MSGYLAGLAPPPWPEHGLFVWPMHFGSCAAQALEMKGGRRKMWNRKGAGGDRVERLRAALGASDSPEEALLKRCSHFDLTGNSNSAVQVRAHREFGTWLLSPCPVHPDTCHCQWMTLGCSLLLPGQACREIVSLREEQLERCKSEITEAIAKGLRMLDSIRTTVCPHLR